MEEKIRQRFKALGLPKPGTIRLVGPWAHGMCYAVTCGWFRLQRYCVYCVGDHIQNVRRRD